MRQALFSAQLGGALTASGGGVWTLLATASDRESILTAQQPIALEGGERDGGGVERQEGVVADVATSQEGGLWMGV